MSSIDAQIKSLLLKKKKIDYVSYIADLVKNDTKCIDFKDVKKEIVDQIEPFLLKLMTSIETGQPVKSDEPSSEFSQEQKEALLTIAARVIEKKSQPASGPSPYNPEVVQTTAKQKAELNSNDKMNFALNNRHLASKRVQILNDANAQIFGQVVGLDAPFIIVKTETGPTIQVPLEKVVPL